MNLIESRLEKLEADLDDLGFKKSFWELAIVIVKHVLEGVKDMASEDLGDDIGK